MKYKNGQPVEVGDVVHVKNRAYTVYSERLRYAALNVRARVLSLGLPLRHRRVYPTPKPFICGVNALMTISLIAAAVVILMILVFDL